MYPCVFLSQSCTLSVAVEWRGYVKGKKKWQGIGRIGSLKEYFHLLQSVEYLGKVVVY